MCTTVVRDFSAILNVALEWADLPKAPARLDAVTPELSAIWGESASRPRQWSLDLRERCYYVAGPAPDDEDESLACRLHPGLEGPFSLCVVPHGGITTIENIARWKFFLLDLEGWRSRLRRSAKLIGEALGATQIMYVPDLALEEIAEQRLHDQAYPQLVAHFQSMWGDPSSLALVYPLGERYWERYFVEPLNSLHKTNPKGFFLNLLNCSLLL